MYDHISFHTETQADLPPHQAVCHMAAYYTWAVANDLHSTAAAALPEFAQWQQGQIDAAQFILTAFGGGLDATCFNDTGRLFSEYYYVDEDEGYGHFMNDYFQALELTSEADFYRQNHHLALQQRLNPVLQVAFERWQATRRLQA